ncbi:MAG: aminopeptidase [Caulobacterales bacterium 32-69-10]|nr:MAG: aminopeptidase [Caulobacterales bacterium 32-69-10]
MSETLPHHLSDGLHAAGQAPATIPIHILREADLDAALEAAGPATAALAAAHEFKAAAGQVLVVPGEGGIGRVLCGLGSGSSPMALRALPGKLPAGDYRFEALAGLDPELATLAWSLGRYGFDRYRSDRKADRRPSLAAPEGVEVEAVRRIAHACALARDMVNTPANDMGPRQIETIAREIAEEHGATITVVAGEALLDEGYPAIHAVGRAAAPGREPRMIEISWNGAGADAPVLALVGKGVVFDTGGLDIKPSAGMRTMKKDMGGAAHALALARMVMGARLPVRLTVLLPVVENAISGDAMRPGDVLASRKGLSIEVGNTDAEGRLILADALARAGELAPDLTIDLATLTGAARVALGPEVIPFFTADDALAASLSVASGRTFDPLWRLPLWAGYGESLNSEVADLANDPAAWAQAGAITAALFLQRFAPQSGSWVHLDVFAWNARGRPGWPAGAEAQSIRALFRVLQDRYGGAA